MTSSLVERPPVSGLSAASIEAALVGGDLSKLNTEQRLAFYNQVCHSLGLNPLTKPFEYITLNGKLTFYAKKDCTEQLRKIHDISITIPAREEVAGCYVVTARASLPNRRTDESIGAVPIEGLKGEARANALMKAETKAKRRVTLSISGLGMLDESEADGILQAPAVTVEPVPEIPAGAFLVTSVEKVEGTSKPSEKNPNGRPYTFWRVRYVSSEGVVSEASTFDPGLADSADDVWQAKQPVVIVTEKNKRGTLDLLEIHRPDEKDSGVELQPFG